MSNMCKGLAIILAVLVVTWGKPSQAGTFAGNGGATESTQNLNLGQLIITAVTLIKQLNQLRLSGKALGGSSWGETATDLTKLDQIVRQSGAIGYSAQNLEQQFQTLYPGYSQYTSQRIGPTDLAGKYTQWSNETNNAVLGALRIAGLQSKNFASEESTVAQLRMFSSSAVGQMQAAQAGNQIMAAMIDQMQKLRQLLMVSMQMHGDYMVVQADKEAAQGAASVQMNHKAQINTEDGAKF